jgi:hypothetical protein
MVINFFHVHSATFDIWPQFAVDYREMISSLGINELG